MTTHRHEDTQTDRQADRQTYGQTGRQTQADREHSVTPLCSCVGRAQPLLLASFTWHSRAAAMMAKVDAATICSNDSCITGNQLNIPLYIDMAQTLLQRQEPWLRH